MNDDAKQLIRRTIERITAHAYHYYHAPPHPNELAGAQEQLAKALSEDWRTSFQQYAHVVEYFYSLVELTLPDDRQPEIVTPALGSTEKSPKKRTQKGDVNQQGRVLRCPAQEVYLRLDSLTHLRCHEPSLLEDIGEEQQLGGNSQRPRDKKISPALRQRSAGKGQGIPYRIHENEKPGRIFIELKTERSPTDDAAARTSPKAGMFSRGGSLLAALPQHPREKDMGILPNSSLTILQVPWRKMKSKCPARSSPGQTHRLTRQMSIRATLFFNLGGTISRSLWQPFSKHRTIGARKDRLRPAHHQKRAHDS